MNPQNDAWLASPARLHRRTLLGGFGTLLGAIVLAACGGSTGAQETATPPPAPTASGGNTGAQGPPPSPPTPYPNGVIVSTSVGAATSGPLSALASATPAPPAPPVNGVKTITNADSGATLNLPAGTQVVLTLESGYDWAVTAEDQTVLTPVVGATPPPGAQGVYAATKPGRTTLTAVGDPPCRKAQPPCAAPTVLFRVQIVVT